jgi:hypothetical protein
MVPIAAVILTESSPTKFAGVDLNERAARIAHRAGIFDVHFSGGAPPAGDTLARLRAEGWRVTVSVSEGRPLETAPLAQTVVVLPARTIIEPAALVSLIARASKTDQPSLVVTPAERRKSHNLRIEGETLRSVMGDGNAISTGIAILPEASLARVRRIYDYNEAIHRLGKSGVLRALTTDQWFCRALAAKEDLRAVEREYAAHTHSQEGVFARLQSAARRAAAIRLVPATWNLVPSRGEPAY